MVKNKKKEIDTKIVRSVNKNIRSSTRKLKPLLKSIVGKKVDIALRDLTFSDKRICLDIKKTLSSADNCGKRGLRRHSGRQAPPQQHSKHCHVGSTPNDFEYFFANNIF